MHNKSEHINEKFTVDSDPIKDMEIGIEYAINKWLKTLQPKQQYFLDESKLAIAAQYGKTDFVKYLIDKGTNIHTWEEWALRWAAANGHIEIVKLLIDAGADIHPAVMWNYAYQIKKDNYYFKNLINGGANPKELLKIAEKANNKKAQYILKKIIKDFINEKFTQDSDPIADMNIGMMNQIKLWMESINDKFYNKNYALGISAENGKLDFVKYLLYTGANVHANNDYALRWASDSGHVEVVKVLLAVDANVHAADNYALRWASVNGHAEVVKVLKDHIAKEKYNKNKKINMEKISEDTMSGVSAPQSTSMNTPGMGNVSPAGIGITGSGDKFGNTVGGKPYTQGGKTKKKKPMKKTIKKVEENNLNPYDKLGMAMAKKLGIKPPFKKKKGSKNQNAMTQRKFEHQILTFDEFRNQLNENK